MTNNRNNQGTGFTNFNDVLKANQNSGQRMGQAVANGLQSQAGAVNQNLQDQQGQFNQGIQNAQDQWSNVSQLANQLATSGQNQDWSNIANNIGDLTDAGNNFRNYQYNGPSGLKNASGLQAQAQAASDTGRLAGTNQGQQQLLGQYVGGHGYNQGQAQFDQALLNKYGRGDINQAKKSLVGLGEKVNNIASGDQTAAQTQGNVVKSQQQDLGKKLTDILGSQTGTTGLLGTAATNAKNTNTEISELQKILQGTIEPGKYTQQDVDLLNNLPQTLQKYGLSDANLGQKFNVWDANNSPSAQKNILNSLATGLNQSGNVQFQTPEQQKAAQLLSQFTGSTDVANQLGNNQGVLDPSKAFTGGLNLRNLSEQLGNNAGQNLDQYQQDYARTQDLRNNTYLPIYNGIDVTGIGPGIKLGPNTPITSAGFSSLSGQYGPGDYSANWLVDQLGKYGAEDQKTINQINNSQLTLADILKNKYGNNNSLDRLNDPNSAADNSGPGRMIRG